MHSGTHPFQKLKHLAETDKSMLSVLMLIAGVVSWLLLTTCAPWFAKQSMQRFHLQTNSFLGWSCQFPIPSMYNFANQYKVEHYPPGLTLSWLDENEERFINHFPTRCFTFADARDYYLSQKQNRWISLETSYREEKLVSKYHLKPQAGNQKHGTRTVFELIRLSSTFDHESSAEP